MAFLLSPEKSSSWLTTSIRLSFGELFHLIFNAGGQKESAMGKHAWVNEHCLHCSESSIYKPNVKEPSTFSGITIHFDNTFSKWQFQLSFPFHKIQHHLILRTIRSIQLGKDTLKWLICKFQFSLSLNVYPYWMAIHEREQRRSIILRRRMWRNIVW